MLSQGLAPIVFSVYNSGKGQDGLEEGKKEGRLASLLQLLRKQINWI